MGSNGALASCLMVRMECCQLSGTRSQSCWIFTIDFWSCLTRSTKPLSSWTDPISCTMETIKWWEHYPIDCCRGCPEAILSFFFRSRRRDRLSLTLACLLGPTASTKLNWDPHFLHISLINTILETSYWKWKKSKFTLRTFTIEDVWSNLLHLFGPCVMPRIRDMNSTTSLQC